MSRNVTSLRLIVILFLAVTLCLAMIHSAHGQMLAVLTESLEPDFMAVAAPDIVEPPGPIAPPAAEAEPPLTPPDQETKPLVSPAEPADEPADEPSEAPDLDSMLASRGPIVRLASVPNMFGDSFSGGGQLRVCDFAGCRMVDIPPPGGGRHVKITENDKALPMDRVFFVYNHFQNAVDT